MATSNDHRWPMGSPHKGTVAPPVTGGFSTQRDSNRENISIWWRYNEQDGISHVQYIPRNMHTVFALLCFVVVIHWLIFPYLSGLLHWHCGNLTIAPVPAKQPWWIWINTSCEFIMNDCITTTKQSTTKPCAYFLGYTVCNIPLAMPTGYDLLRNIVVCYQWPLLLTWFNFNPSMDK